MLRGILPALALAGLTALTLPGSGNAQVPQPERGRMGDRAGMGQPGEAHAARILELREQLGLTDAQVERIRGIQARLEEQNAPLLARMTAAREKVRTERQQMTPEQRQAMRERMQAERQQMTPEQRAQMRQTPGSGMPEELQPVMEQLRTNNQSAMEQVRAVLSAEQQEKLRATRQSGQRQPGMRQGPGGQRQPGMRQGPGGGQHQPGMRQGGAGGQRQPGMRQPPRDGRGRVPGAAAGTR